MLHKQVAIRWKSWASPLPSYSLSKEQSLKTIAGIVWNEQVANDFGRSMREKLPQTCGNMFFSLPTAFWSLDLWWMARRNHVTTLLDRNHSLSSQKMFLCVSLRASLCSFVLRPSLKWTQKEAKKFVYLKKTCMGNTGQIHLAVQTTVVTLPRTSPLIWDRCGGSFKTNV